jgi:hypothetical protein
MKQLNLDQQSDLGKVFSIWERMQPGFKEEHPKCIDDRGHYFKTCGTCFTMICRRCQYRTLDFLGSMGTTYGDFSGTHAPYDRYCSDCGVILQRGTEGWKCYEDYEADRIKKGDTVCRMCGGIGYCKCLPGLGDPNKPYKCERCDGTGLFPSPYRRKQIEQGKKITERIDEPLWKRINDRVKIFLHNNNPWGTGIIIKLKKRSIEE